MKNKGIVMRSLTIPNLISIVRIVIVPFFVHYFLIGEVVIAALLIIASAFTDFFDGMIARKFNQITQLGKMLDPLADKITQIAIAICLAIKFPVLIPFMILFLSKELTMLIMASILIKTKKKPCAAQWYGKVSTALFYISVSLIVLLDMIKVSPEIFLIVSMSLLSLTAIMMIYSAISYFKIYLKIKKEE